jgi:anthranilate phosphoribosyltransferase
MTSEHPFAQFVRILGKGPNLSRPLSFDEARQAGRAIMEGAVEPIQLGAFLCLLRVKTEIPEEVAGLAAAARDSLTLPAGLPAVDLDWPSYAGKARQPPFFLLSALLLAGAGLRIFMHGAENHGEGRIFLSEALAALGLSAAADPQAAAEGLARRNFAYLPIERLQPRFGDLFALRRLLGVRSPFHTVIRHLNPFDARCELLSVAHPAYRPIHVGAARLLGVRWMAVFKGEGGEAERRPEKPCEMLGLADGEAFGEDWPALPGLASPPPAETVDVGRLARLWRGEDEDPYAIAVVITTAAVALKAMGRAATQEAALEEARRFWSLRSPTFT